MRYLDLPIAILDAVTAAIGRAFSWLTLFMVLMTFVNVLLRYVFGLSVVAAHETVIYAFGIVMTGVGGWALLTDQHVRIDVFYGGMSARAKAIVNVGGTLLFLAPLLYVIASRSVDYVARSWKVREGSAEIAGLDYLYVLKSFILVFVVVLGLQAISFFLRNLRILVLGYDPAPPPRVEDVTVGDNPLTGQEKS
ncbi:hypothetical protein BOO69_02365 [Sulfitobacter alexandrii]|uniref:TRAP transporter small permease protein n=1 Tax=Sulfitobacter alexandrii TaxID=1917485 RepID=A0A1J0WDJ0_9RHOB|nr:TRAP transporter small permease subunit [Sulfitobacter alexandrii]APE42385.1 hypothetical protein BOO69_02365 [Sulfitobacter alexandrii]